MKPVPQEIIASGPEGTVWFGGAVDRSLLSLRVKCPNSEIQAVSDLLGCCSEPAKRGWSTKAPDAEPADLDSQVRAILSRLTPDLDVWRQVCSKYEVDLFCGLFLERTNRGIGLNAETLLMVGERGISFSFDIYSPD